MYAARLLVNTAWLVSVAVSTKHFLEAGVKVGDNNRIYRNVVPVSRVRCTGELSVDSRQT